MTAIFNYVDTAGQPQEYRYTTTTIALAITALVAKAGADCRVISISFLDKPLASELYTA